MSVPPLLSASDLVVRRGEREVLHGVSLELCRGEVVALLGPNGAGKSTLLDVLSGALAPARGELTRRGRVAVALQSAELARRTALENVVLALAWWGVPRGERAARARSALESLSAGQLAQRPVAALSGGERRRVHLARALAVRPDVLLLDEPFAGLDAKTRGALLDDSLSVVRSGERATLVVVHDRAEAWALADRLLILLDGRIVAAGTPRTLLEQPPDPAVARFLGFDGALERDGELWLTRPTHVVLDADGPLQAVVARTIPLEDGARLELELPEGRLYTVAPHPLPRTGEAVRLRVDGGVRFSASRRSPSST